ncbi:hypothetical protein [Streptomyces violascens]|uniref:hypothetical protein n=1 Tax=Streptomyces violascens TaxID=67381 RepID=UPI001CFC98FC|nr:hypothetical protein [Streptomyces violascens]
MISTRRIATVLVVAAGAAGLAASTASAESPVDRLVKAADPATELDAIATSNIPEEYRAQFPTTRDQLAGLSRLNDANKVTQVADQAAPLTNLVPEVG